MSLLHGGCRSGVEDVGASYVSTGGGSARGASTVDVAVASDDTSLSSLATLHGTVVVGREVLVVGELAALEVERRVVAPAEREEVEQSENGLGKKVENTIEHHLSIGRNGVATVCETPGDLWGVSMMEQVEEGSGNDEEQQKHVGESKG